MTGSARAGTHQPPAVVLRDAGATIPLTMNIGGYGSLRSQGRRIEGVPSALRLQLFRRLRREVSEDAVGAGALERQQAFHHRPLAVDPAIAAGRRDHRV